MPGTLEIKESELDRFKKAIETGDTQQVQALLKENSTLANMIVGYGSRTALHIAAEKGHEKVVETLLQFKLEMSATRSIDCETALHMAAKKGHEKIVGMLLTAKPELSTAVARLNKTALHLAVASGHEKIVEMLLQLKPELINDVDSNGDTVLHCAVWNRHEKVMGLLLTAKPALIDAVDNKGKTVLHWAAQAGSEPGVGMLLRLKPELINAVDNSGQTVLHSVAQNGSEPVAGMLLKLKPELINTVDNDGKTALHCATQSGCEPGVGMLLKIKPELINAVDNSGRNILHCAAQAGSEPGVGMVLKLLRPVQIRAVDKDGKTALHWATERMYGGEKIVEILLQKRPEFINEVDKDGKTVLHSAAASGNVGVVGMLLKTKPELINIADKQNKTALHWAIEKNHENIITLLANGNVDILKTSIAGLCQAKAVLEGQLKALKPEETANAARLDQAVKNSQYSREKIYKLLSVQLQNEKNINIEILELQNFTKDSITEQQLQNFIDLAVKGNKTLAIALHLHGSAWAGLVLKHLGGNNLQVIYNDPAGNAFTMEPAVQGLINSLIEQNHAGATNIIELKPSQKNVEADSGALVVGSLVKLATAESLNKTNLQNLLSRSEEINELKEKHLLIEETTLDYSSYKLKKILELSLKDQSVTIAPVTVFEDKPLLLQNAKAAVTQVMDSGISIVMPLSIQGKYWSGLVIKKQLDGSLQVIYNNPTGNALRAEKNAMTLIDAIMELNSDIHILDIRCKQDDNKQASGAFTVNNLVKLSLSDTSDFHKEDFQKLLSISPLASGNIDELRHHHTQLVYDYVIPVTMSANGGREPFEQKEKYIEDAQGPLSHGVNDDLVQMHVLGQDAEA